MKQPVNRSIFSKAWFLNIIPAMIFVLCAGCVPKDWEVDEEDAEADQSQVKGIDLDVKSSIHEIARYENIFVGDCRFMVILEKTAIQAVSFPKGVYDLFVAGDKKLETLGSCDKAEKDERCQLADSAGVELTDWFAKTMHAKIYNTDFHTEGKEHCKKVMSDYGEVESADGSERLDRNLVDVEMITMMVYPSSHPFEKGSSKENLNYTIYYGDTFPVVLKLTVDANYKLVVDDVTNRNDRWTEIKTDSDQQEIADFSESTGSIIPSAMNITGADLSNCKEVLDGQGKPLKDSLEKVILDCSEAIKAQEAVFVIGKQERELPAKINLRF